jgi:Rrf2 family protein
MPDLAAAGLVVTKRGHHGGILLSRLPNQITLLQISEAIEGRAWLDRCLLGLESCSDERACPTHQFWKQSRRAIELQLRSTTLADVAAHERAKTQPAGTPPSA